MSVTVTPRILLNASLQSWEAGWVNSPRGFESRILRPCQQTKNVWMCLRLHWTAGGDGDLQWVNGGSDGCSRNQWHPSDGT
jgi:hypothetical protein